MIKPYFALDIETTGLDIAKSQVLEIGIIYDDGQSEIQDLPKLNILVDNKVITHGESFALGMNTSILEEIRQQKGISLRDAQLQVKDFLEKWNENSPSAVSIAGKNVGVFDVPILKNQGFTIKCKHRFIDVGSIYFIDFGYNPGLNEINQKLGISPVSHRALDDALNVVQAIRAKVNT
jgi:oligoribonuclease (3'-5' exoribonuclease)